MIRPTFAWAVSYRVVFNMYFQRYKIVKLISLLFCIGLLLQGCKDPGVTKINIAILLREMVNGEIQTRLAHPSYHLVQVSSWDRTQTNPDNPETWFANKDYNYSIRQEKMEEQNLSFWMLKARELSPVGGCHRNNF